MDKLNNKNTNSNQYGDKENFKDIIKAAKSKGKKHHLKECENIYHWAVNHISFLFDNLDPESKTLLKLAQLDNLINYAEALYYAYPPLYREHMKILYNCDHNPKSRNIDIIQDRGLYHCNFWIGECRKSLKQLYEDIKKAGTLAMHLQSLFPLDRLLLIQDLYMYSKTLAEALLRKSEIIKSKKHKKTKN